MRPREIGVVVLVAMSCACSKAAPKATTVDPRETKSRELQAENQRLRAELEAAQQTSAALDQSLRNAEESLAALPGLDSNIQSLRRNIETGVVTPPSDDLHVKIDRLRDLLARRERAVSQAQAAIAAAEQQASKVAAQKQAQYVAEIAQLKTAVTQRAAENAQLARERVELERKYREAVEDAKEARGQAAAARAEADEERREREQAEIAANRVRIAVGPVQELRRKGIVQGHWYQHKKTDCSGAEGFTESDRRTLTTIQIPAPLGRVNVFSNHSKGSYGLVPTGEQTSALEIHDKAKFWSDVRCVVVGF